jgi:hypothetical protein
MSDELRERHFVKVEGGWHPREQLLRRVRFERLNLASPDAGTAPAMVAGMHLIFCENVLIYLAPAAVAAVAQLLYDALAVDGWLFTATTDPHLEELAPFGVVALRDRAVYRRALKAARSPRVAEMPMPLVLPTPPVTVVAPDTAAVVVTAVEPVRRPTAPVISSTPELLVRIRALADAGRSLEAHGMAVSAAKSDPDCVEVHYLIAVIRLERGDHIGAATAARRAAYLEPGLTVAALVLASALRGSGDLSGARRAYRRARAQLARVDASEPVRFADGELAGGLLRSVEALLSTIERPS